jgi:DNA topoisomerase III
LDPVEKVAVIDRGAGAALAKADARLASRPPQMLYAKKIAQGKGVIIPDEAKANSAAMSAWID